MPHARIQYRQAERTDIPHMARIWGIEKSEGGTSEERMTAYFDGQLHPQHALPPRGIYVALRSSATSPGTLPAASAATESWSGSMLSRSVDDAEWPRA